MKQTVGGEQWVGLNPYTGTAGVPPAPSGSTTISEWTDPILTRVKLLLDAGGTPAVPVYKLSPYPSATFLHSLPTVHCSLLTAHCHDKLLIVLKDFLAFLFRRTPRSVRLFLTRFGHTRFTVSAGAVIVNEQGQVLLLKHVFRTGSGWGIPGGFIDAHEQPEAALRRELREEVGLELSCVRFALVRTFSHRQLELIFLCQPNGEAHPRGLEIKRAAWFAPDELPEELSTDQEALIKRVLKDGAKSQS